MPSKTIILPWPAGGVVRRTSFQESPLAVTPDAVNVRTSDAILGRDRGGSRPGLSKAYEEVLPGPVRMMQTVRFVQHEHVKSRLVLSAAGNLYMEDDRGGIVLKKTTPTLSSYTNLMAVDFGGKLYIANTGRGSISGDWLSIPRLTPDGDPWENGIARPNYYADLAASDSEITARLALDGPPIVYDPVADTLANLAAVEGTIPDGCQIIEYYAGRLVLAGDPASPTQWYMSKVLDPTDWDYSSTDADAAVSATSSGSAGIIGSPITAFVRHTDLCASIACATELWLLRGDPITGTTDNVSHDIGIVDKHAWCHTPDGWIVFLSHDGVYAIPSGCDSRKPEPISRARIPEELLGVNANRHTILMAYDLRHRGIHICLSSNDPSKFESSHWWLDWRGDNKAFFRVQFPELAEDNFDPMSMCHRRDISTTESQVFYGCRDGGIRSTNSEYEDDDSQAFDSYVWLGPIQPMGPDGNGMILSVAGSLAEGSGDVSWSLHPGESAEIAYNSPAVSSGKFTDYSSKMQVKQRMRVLANTAWIKLSAVTAGEAWAIEKVCVEVGPSGCPGGC